MMLQPSSANDTVNRLKGLDKGDSVISSHCVLRVYSIYAVRCHADDWRALVIGRIACVETTI